MTLEEYLEFDRQSDERFEFIDGEVYSMSGGSPEHSLLANRVGRLLGNQLDNRGCKVFQADLRIKVPSMPPYRYADVSALCGEAEYDDAGKQRMLANPVLIVEVLSPSTQLYDRTRKFNAYKSIASLKEYLLISQDERYVILYTRHNDRFWLQSEYSDGEVLKLTSVECNLSVNEIYEGIIAGEN